MHTTDLDLTGKDITELSSSDALTAFLARLGYRTEDRTSLTAEAIGLAGDSAATFRRIELLSEDEEQLLRVVFAQPKSLTAKARNDLARVLGRSTIDHLLILAADYETLEFVLLDKRKKEQQGPKGGERVQVVPKTVSVSRRTPARLDLRTLRRLTWTSRDALDQFDKLRSVFDAALYTGEFFQNRGLFADYFLRERLRDDAAWGDNPADSFSRVRDLLHDAPARWQGKEKEVVRGQLFKPLFERLGFRPVVNRPARTDQTQPDYLLRDADGRVLTAAFVYPWDRWLDGPDQNDPDTPEENPGACVVTALDQGLADWVVVTNGRLWRLYGKHAHSRATNFYEVDLPEALIASADTDPNEAFRYFWLFFRAAAFAPQADSRGCWLDAVLTGSREYARRLGDRLKERVFYTIFPHLARGFLDDRRGRLGIRGEPSEDELADVFQATLTLLYRMLFLLYAESRDLLPVGEAAYRAASLKRMKEEVAERAGVAESDVPTRLEKAYSAKETALYDRLADLSRTMDCGDPVLNVPTYNGGLFVTRPDDSDRREQRIARFLQEHKVPDCHLALALDRLARDQDERTLALVFIDYKSLEVRHLGAIYEGLLEFKLKVADEDLTTQGDGKGEKYLPLSQTKPRRGRTAEVVVRRKEVYLSNDKADRKASGSYYTPDTIVEYIVTNTVGPVLAEKLEALRPEFRKVRRTFTQELQKSEAYPSAEVRKGETDHRSWAAAKTYAAHKELVEQFFDLKVLDPAMGSGHFLVEAVDFITDQLIKFLNQFPINPVNLALDRTRASILASLGEQGVTIDPIRLTDINLLKRHVLKRCIYGVDLNPMAVELAKVSLWLDAFTLGAPLSFLDHHLRCGNSLIGATFADLEGDGRDQLFTVNYEPLLRAINGVLNVSKLADATAAEASSSAALHNEFLKEVEGYRIAFDALVAEYFGVEGASAFATLADTTLNNREAELKARFWDKRKTLLPRVEAVAKERHFFHWESEFPEVFFGFVGLDRRQARHKDKIEPGSAGFDVVIGNPPYDVLAEKELEADLSDVLNYFRRAPIFAPACGGKMNLYKLFVCRGVHLLSRRGRIGHIVPMALLGDEQAVGVRKLLLNQTALAAVEAFPQKDDSRNRVFEEAKLSTCVFVTAKTDEDLQFRSRVHQGKVIEDNSPSLLIRRGEVKLYDPENQPIVACSQGDWDLAVMIMSNGRMTRLGECCTTYQGEVNETTDRGKGHISYDSGDGSLVLRGANVTLYALRPSSQGEDIYLRRTLFLKGKRPSAKAWHHQQHRAGFQRKAPQNNFRRLIACRIPAGQFCCESISYFPESESTVPLDLIIGLLNSKLLEWFFRLSSTNAVINEYQIRNLPMPVFAPGKPGNITIPAFNRALDSRKWDKAMEAVEAYLASPPFPIDVVNCIVELVTRITQIESQRGDIARSDRSALAPAAQPYQDLIDRMLYRMAGLTPDEAAGLESRLANML